MGKFSCVACGYVLTADEVRKSRDGCPRCRERAEAEAAASAEERRAAVEGSPEIRRARRDLYRRAIVAARAIARGRAAT